mmetsp:Transcript_30960/g.46972  ORF Transcript_30960/g.46972 Transcript_30960/m.46972 type:complete len:160 (-) Transcript_30960:50-529(-)|eukprot:CAMPEP_0178905800 /NCGR_PEP_ID=MMETSP0786-20121207/6477_1 /TAXON_ID=186022 /ORGANISM="Thalassionema frauenfeldii, Strain CCMP 1798" /LENGTH=159 /DNA_ID=CAMNT_0020577449 /DNA_START=93 /DNA_END=572 /DNA_ORIENTATION=+
MSALILNRRLKDFALSSHQSRQLSKREKNPSKSEEATASRTRRNSEQDCRSRIKQLKDELATERRGLDELCQKKDKIRQRNFYLNRRLRIMSRESFQTKELEEVEKLSQACDDWQTSIDMYSYETELIGVKTMNLQSEIRQMLDRIDIPPSLVENKYEW